jgi:phenylacetate-CoA ligase
VDSVRQALSRKNLWNWIGGPGRSVVGSALSLFPLDALLGSKFREQYRFASEAQRWRAEQALAWQARAVHDVCLLAAQTPFYRREWQALGLDPRDIATLNDFRRLPTIDRSTLNAHLDDMCVPTVPRASSDYVSTGGTSGTPLRFYIGRDRSAAEFAHILVGWERAGYRLGMPLAVFRGRVVPPDRTGLRHEYDPLLRHHFYSNFHMSDQNMDRYLRQLELIGPCFLHVYPSSVFALARFIRRTGRAVPANIKGILAESEMVYPEQREFVQETLGVRYFSSYGHTEKLVAAAECEHTSDYHVFPTYGYCELLDSEGRPVAEHGRVGEIVGTGFINRVVPFIRYRTGDYATYAGDRCAACGREQMRLSSIEGHRVQESLVMRDGTVVSWTAVNVHDDTFERVLRFQFYQETAGRAVLKIVPAATFADADAERILSRLRRRLDQQLDIEIRVVEEIALTTQGKSIYVDQRIASHSAPINPSFPGEYRARLP